MKFEENYYSTEKRLQKYINNSAYFFYTSNIKFSIPEIRMLTFIRLQKLRIDIPILLF